MGSGDVTVTISPSGITVLTGSHEYQIPYELPSDDSKTKLYGLGPQSCKRMGKQTDCKRGPNKQHSLFRFMDDTIGSLIRQNRPGTARNYMSALESFRRFRRGKDISLDKIDRDEIEEYQTYLKLEGLTRNTASFYMRILRAVYNRAIRHGLMENRYPFQNVFTGMEKTSKRAIPASDISMIQNLDLSGCPKLEFARDIFMFLFYCRGMSFVDAAFLRKSDIRNGVLTYCRRKTGRQLHVKVINRMYEVIDRHISRDSEFVFPIITKRGKNERRQYETGLRLVNQSLKTVGELAGVSTCLTTYVARHSWATIAKTKNVPLSIISDALGHESANTTRIYLASINPSEIDIANELVLADI